MGRGAHLFIEGKPAHTVFFKRLPTFEPAGDLLVGDFHIHGAVRDIDRDHIAVFDDGPVPAGIRFRGTVADRQAAGRSGEAAVSDCLLYTS